ncbi:hypothetical protein AB0D33_01280 [Streptomyces sp. NPDC048404]|uniref:hypothetical protein n=1 Tax=unclassified Streptomyces TaxID=2593676 RepID=UPI00341AC70D
MSGPLKKYRVVRNGFETVMKLSDEDAAKLGALAPYQVSDAVSTIEPVTAVGDDGGDESGDPADTTGAVVSEDPGDGQSEVKTEGDGDGQAVTAEPVPAPAKRRSSGPNKARTSAANKAADGGN